MKTFLLLGSLLCFITGSAEASPWSSEPLNPGICVSANGIYSLAINPDDRNGEGGSNYVFRENDAIIWEEHRDYTLRDVQLTDSGDILGYAYVAGTTRRSVGNLDLWVIDRLGKTRYHRQYQRELGALHSSPAPTCGGVIIDAAHDRAAFMVLRPKRYYVVQPATIPDTGWPILNLTSGAEEGALYIDAELLGIPRPAALESVKVLSGASPLLFTYIARGTYDDPNGSPNVSYGKNTGSRFLLLDWAGKVHWRFDDAQDFDFQQLGVEAALVENTLKENALAEVTTDRNGFSILQFAESVKIHYRLGAGGVPEETGREAFNWRYIKPEPDTIVFAPHDALRYADSLLLAQPSASGFPAAVGDFAFDEHGRMGMVAREADEFRFYLLDANRNIITMFPLPTEIENLRGDFCHLGGDRWCLMLTGFSRPDQFWIINAQEKSVTSVPLPSHHGDKVVALTDDVVVVLSSQGDAVRAFRLSGELLWEVRGGYPRPGGLLSPEDVAVTAAGEVVVLENVASSLHFYDANGAWLRTLKTKELPCGRLRYPTEVTAPRNGEILVKDADGQIHRFTATGVGDRQINKYLGNSTMRDNVGHPLEHIGELVVDPADRIWVMDHTRIMRLGDSAADICLSKTAAGGGLLELGTVQADGSGNYYVMDERNFTVSVFSDTGLLLRTVTPDTGLVKVAANDRDYFVGADEQLYILVAKGDIMDRGATEYAVYDRHGKFVMILPMGAGSFRSTYLGQLRHARLWQFNHDALKLLALDGEEQQAIRTGYDGKWLGMINHNALGPDDEVILLDRTGDPGEWDETALKVHLFDAAGQLLGGFALPPPWNKCYMTAFDGTYCYFGYFEPARVRVTDRAGNEVALMELTSNGRPIDIRQILCDQVNGYLLVADETTLYRFRLFGR